MGEQAARARQSHVDGVVVGDADVAAEVGVADAEVGQGEHGDEEEGEVLQPYGGGDHEPSPASGDAGAVVAVAEGSGSGSSIGGITWVPGRATTLR